MRVSRTRCKGAMQASLDGWTIEGRLRTSDAHQGAHWGTCALCGKRHYDAPYDENLYGGPRSIYIPNILLQEVIEEAKQKGISRSKVIVNALKSRVKTS